MSELVNTAAWLDALYGRCRDDDGEIVVVSAKRSRIASVHRVGTGGTLVEAARAMHREPGSYLKINLMDYRAMYQRAKETGKPVVGSQSEVKTVVAFYADVDAGKSGKYASRRAALFMLDQMPHKPTLIINSNGGKGGFHAYWLLRQPLRIECDEHRVKLHEVSRAWQERLKSLLDGMMDSTANLDRVLRCVGVPRLDGGRVCLESCDWSRLYRMEDFDGDH